MSRFTDNGQVVGAESVEECVRRQVFLDTGPRCMNRTHWLTDERISRLGLSTGPGEREGCSALATLDNSPGLVLSDGSPELEALKDAADGPELRSDYYTNDKPAKKPRKSRKKP